MVFEIFDRSNEAVTALGQRFDKAGVLGMVAQRLSQLVYGDSQAVIEVDSGVRAPQLLLEFLPADHLAWTLQERSKDLEGLALKPDPNTRAAQFSSFEVRFKDPELHLRGTVFSFCHCHCTRSIHPEKAVVNAA
jgi:hypothetical protein